MSEQRKRVGVQQRLEYLLTDFLEHANLEDKHLMLHFVEVLKASRDDAGNEQIAVIMRGLRQLCELAALQLKARG